MAANPASVYCTNKYGPGEKVISKAGETYVFRLPDGKLYEEWYVYYRETDPEYFKEWSKFNFARR